MLTIPIRALYFFVLAALVPPSSAVPLNTEEAIALLKTYEELHIGVLATVDSTTANNVLVNGPLITTGLDALAAAFAAVPVAGAGSRITNVTEQDQIEDVMQQIVDTENLFVSGLVEKRVILIDAGFRQSIITSSSNLLSGFQATGPVVFDALPDTHDRVIGIYDSYELPIVNLTIEYSLGSPGSFE